MRGGECRVLRYAFPMSAAVLDFKELPISERLQLVEDIWDSIAAETSATLQLTADERAELHRRRAAHQTDPASSVPWEEVRTTLLRRGAG